MTAPAADSAPDSLATASLVPTAVLIGGWTFTSLSCTGGGGSTGLALRISNASCPALVPAGLFKLSTLGASFGLPLATDTAEPVSPPINASRAAAPNTPCISGVSIPARVIATFCAYCPCPACKPSVLASLANSVAVRRANPGAAFSTACSATFLATGLPNISINLDSTPVPPANAPIPVAAAILPKFSPR